MTGRSRRTRARSPKPDPTIVEREMRALAGAIDGMELPAVEKISDEHTADALRILVGTMLSARTQDATTHAASSRLFRAAPSAAAMATLTTQAIEKLIFPVGFYRNKAKFVKGIADAIVNRFNGQVPDTLDELVTLPGVGRKTANLVMILAFRSRENICVDTHVHRIANRLGWVRTREPQETEQALYRAIEQRWWPYINLYLVTWGQNVCRPIVPQCDVCVLLPDCPRVGVRERRPRSRAAKSRSSGARP
jgi:endonuclease III